MGDIPSITTYDGEIYDVIHPGALQGDVEWYVERAVASGGPVIELGAGSGRVTIPIAARGIPVTAVDLSESMLARLRDKVAAGGDEVRSRVAIHRSDMRSFTLAERFALAIIPFRAFLHNVTRDDQLATLRCIHAHLRPGGALAFNVFHPSLEYMAASAGALTGTWRWRETRQIGDGRLVLSDASRYDTVRKRVESMIRAEEFGPDGMLRRVHVTHLELAYLYPADITSLLAEAGFEVLRISGDFTGRLFENDRDELVVEARRRAGDIR